MQVRLFSLFSKILISLNLKLGRVVVLLSSILKAWLLTRVVILGILKRTETTTSVTFLGHAVFGRKRLIITRIVLSFRVLILLLHLTEAGSLFTQVLLLNITHRDHLQISRWILLSRFFWSTENLPRHIRRQRWLFRHGCVWCWVLELVQIFELLLILVVSLS